MLGWCSTAQRGQNSCGSCCQPDHKRMALSMQPTIIFDRMAQLPSPCNVTVTVETLEPQDQSQGCHQLEAQRIDDGSFSWAEAVRFEAKTSTTMVIKVQVVSKPNDWTTWFTGPKQPTEAFHASTKRLSIQDLQKASFQGAEHFSFDLIDAVSAVVIGKVILKSPLQNTMIRSMPLKDLAYPSQYGVTLENGADPAYPSQYGATCQNGASVMPPRAAGLTQSSGQTRASSQHTNYPYHMGGG